MKGKRKCKRCNGTGKVFESQKGDGAGWWISGTTSGANGKTCPRCGGSGEVN